MRVLNGAADILLRELIDDAGVFPPAALDTASALREHLRSRESAQSRFLRALVLPASRLNELPGHVELLDEITSLIGGPLPVSVVIDHPDPRPDYAATAEFLRTSFSRVVIRSLEVRIPRVAAVDGAARVRSIIQKLGDAGLPHEISVFIEMPGDAQSVVAEAMAAIADQRESGRSMLHAKFRCGGADASQTADAGDIAFFLTQARRWRIPFKFTGGLHAPLRHGGQVVGAASHGLLNVVGAAVLTFAFDWDARLITTMLQDEDLKHFRLDETCFQWKEHTASPSAVFQARTGFVRSVGSCSFREPVEGLRALGMLPAEAL